MRYNILNKIKERVGYVEKVDKNVDDSYYLGSIKSFGENAAK